MPSKIPASTAAEFDFQLPTRIVFGAGKLDMLGELARDLGARRVAVISDSGIVDAGYPARGLESLAQAGIEGHLFDSVHQNPTTDDVQAGAQWARDIRPDLLVGLGGGSSMDCAKGINFVYTGGGRIQDYQGTGKAAGPMLPMIAVPTTAGTGSETQSYALISDAQTHMKMACGDRRAAFRAAILDPALTLTQPARTTALTGIDALSHAIETYVTRRRNPLSLAFSRQAWQLLWPNFARVLEAPQDIEARSAMQLGACFAGLAIEHSMLGAAHALANPLTAHYGIVHGEAIALMLPHVIRFNSQTCGDSYRELVHSAATMNGAKQAAAGDADQAAAQQLAGDITRLAAQAGLATDLASQGVKAAEIDQLAVEAASQWTAGFNPRRVEKEDLAELYRQAFHAQA